MPSTTAAGTATKSLDALCHLRCHLLLWTISTFMQHTVSFSATRPIILLTFSLLACDPQELGFQFSKPPEPSPGFYVTDSIPSWSLVNVCFRAHHAAESLTILITSDVCHGRVDVAIIIVPCTHALEQHLCKPHDLLIIKADCIG